MSEENKIDMLVFNVGTDVYRLKGALRILYSLIEDRVGIVDESDVASLAYILCSQVSFIYDKCRKLEELLDV